MGMRQRDQVTPPVHADLHMRGDVLEDSIGFPRFPPILRPHGTPRAPWMLHGTMGQPRTAAVLGQRSSAGHVAEGSRQDATSIHPCKSCNPTVSRRQMNTRKQAAWSGARKGFSSAPWV